jgi:hypothetical protein
MVNFLRALISPLLTTAAPCQTTEIKTDETGALRRAEPTFTDSLAGQTIERNDKNWAGMRTAPAHVRWLRPIGRIYSFAL